MLNQDETKKLLATLAELGGKASREEDIVYEGKKIVLPADANGKLDVYIKFLQTKQKEDEEETVFTRTFNYRPWDGAVCAYKAMRDIFGMVSAQAQQGFFGPVPPRMIQVPVSATESVSVPWGDFTITMDKTTVTFGVGMHKEYGMIFQMTVQTPRKNRDAIEGLFKAVEAELKVSSIYRGKAFDGQAEPQFLDLSGVDPSRVVYSEQVQADLEAHVWSLLRHTEEHRRLGLPLKRAVLLTGPYGTGKSLAAYLTAREAVAAGWAFIMARPGRDDFSTVMQTARLYQRAVVFLEDAETVTAAGDSDQISKMLDIFDGIQSKGTELMVILTTNHPEMIHKGMMRPGRLDAVIEIGALDASGIERLIRTVIPASLLADDIDFMPVAVSCEGYVPAFVKEAADRAIRYALARSGGHLDDGAAITTTDLVHAANGLRPQFERMSDAPESAARDSIGSAVEHTVKNAIAQLATPEGEATNSTVQQSVWNIAELAEVQRNGGKAAAR